MSSLREYRERKRALGQTEGAALASDLAALGRSLRVFMANCAELLTFLNATDDPAMSLQLWSVHNRAGFERFLDEVDRLLHNVVAAAVSLKNHSIRVRDKWIKPDPRDHLREQHDARVRQVFADSRTAQLVHGLRNIVQHRKLPRLLGHAEFAPGQPFASKIVLDRDDLLAWDGWSGPIRSFIEESEEPIALDEIVTEYRDAVMGFHNWFGFAVSQRNVAVLKELERQKREVAEYESMLFGPALDDPVTG